MLNIKIRLVDPEFCSARDRHTINNTQQTIHNTDGGESQVGPEQALADNNNELLFNLYVANTESYESFPPWSQKDLKYMYHQIAEALMENANL